MVIDNMQVSENMVSQPRLVYDAMPKTNSVLHDDLTAVAKEQVALIISGKVK